MESVQNVNTIERELTEKLTVRQKAAIPALIAAGSVAEGCREAGISRTIFYEWVKDPEFAEELERQRTEATEEAFESLKQAVGKAVQTLTALLDSNTDSVKLRAALGVIEQANKLKELELAESRITELERRLGIVS